MWNGFQTDDHESMIAETVKITGHGGNEINAYLARPGGNGPFPGMVLVHHLPGWDEFYRETARRFAHHGYLAISPNLYQAFGHGSPSDVAAKARAEGGVSDESVIGNAEAAADYLRSLPSSNGKVGIIGHCSGGRHAYLTACSTQKFDALVDCWGGRVVQAPQELTPQQPVSPVTLTKDLPCPIIGIFGNDDQNPSPDMVNQIEAELKKHGKKYEFHRYDGAGHGFWYYDRPAYRPEQAMDSWQKVFQFLGANLS